MAARATRPGGPRSYPAPSVDFFLAMCQALGIALAVGALFAVVSLQVEGQSMLAVLAALAGAGAAALSVSSDDESIVFGIIVGLLGGWLAVTVLASVVAGASQRAGGGVGAVGGLVVLLAAALAGLSILLPPVSLLVLLALGWLGLARRRRADRKYEGLRILR
jgi:hypothetical protein